VRILTGLNRDLEGLLRATSAMRPYFGENTKDGKFPHLLIQLWCLPAMPAQGMFTYFATSIYSEKKARYRLSGHGQTVIG
jgi:hypothetical protein